MTACLLHFFGKVRSKPSYFTSALCNDGHKGGQRAYWVSEWPTRALLHFDLTAYSSQDQGVLLQYFSHNGLLWVQMTFPPLLCFNCPGAPLHVVGISHRSLPKFSRAQKTPKRGSTKGLCHQKSVPKLQLWARGAAKAISKFEKVFS